MDAHSTIMISRLALSILGAVLIAAGGIAGVIVAIVSSAVSVGRSTAGRPPHTPLPAMAAERRARFVAEEQCRDYRARLLAVSAILLGTPDARAVEHCRKLLDPLHADALRDPGARAQAGAMRSRMDRPTAARSPFGPLETPADQ